MCCSHWSLVMYSPLGFGNYRTRRCMAGGLERHGPCIIFVRNGSSTASPVIAESCVEQPQSLVCISNGKGLIAEWAFESVALLAYLRRMNEQRRPGHSIPHLSKTDSTLPSLGRKWRCGRKAVNHPAFTERLLQPPLRLPLLDC